MAGAGHAAARRQAVPAKGLKKPGSEPDLHFR